MKNIKLALLSSAVMLALMGCNESTPKSETTPTTAAQPSVKTESASAQLDTLLTNYFEDGLQFNPIGGTYIGRNEFNDDFIAPINEANRNEQLNFIKEYKNKLANIDKAQLTGQSLLSYEILARDLDLAIEGSQFPSHLMPINQMGGAHNTFAALGSGQSAQPFNTVEDYKAFEKRADGFIAWLESVEQSMRQGMKDKVVLPKPLAEKLLPQFQTHIVEKPEESLFWGPIAQLPESFSDEQKAELTSAYTAMISERLVPAYQKMADFLANEYIPNARESIGYS